MKALVTGAGGFLGGALAQRLAADGHAVRSLARGDYPQLAAAGIEPLRGNLADPAATLQAVRGSDVVFHVAAKAGIWGSKASFWQANVVGTRNIVDACRRCGVGRLVFTSSPSVVFHGGDMEGADESAPYPAHYEAWYPASKAEAERIVLAAHGPDLATTALRPHLVWGLGDNHLLPRLFARAKAGRLRRIAGPPKRVDTTCLANAVHAHRAAAAALAEGKGGGKAYFIANGEPSPLWELVDRLLATVGLGPVRKTIGPRAAWLAGAACEAAWTGLRLPGEPPMTRFVARELATAHWFDLSAARRDLGYQPPVTVAEGLAELAAAGPQAFGLVQ